MSILRKSFSQICKPLHWTLDEPKKSGLLWNRENDFVERRQLGMTRISDIAARCGLSIATVSKALNGSHEIPDSTVLRVRKAADELGYVPNANARSLKMRKSFTIGVLFIDKTASGLTHEYFSMILESVKREAEKHGYDLTFIASENMANDKPISYVESVRSRGIDGVVIASVDFEAPAVIELAKSGIPVVTIDYVYNGCTAILSDNDNGVASLVEYAYRLGHRKIAFIHGEDTDVTKKRLAGFIRECGKLGLEIPDGFIQSAVYHDPATVSKCVNEIAKLPETPTCLILPDDVSAVATIVSSRLVNSELNKISIAGYDGIALSRMFEPILTTYCQGSDMIGRLAASKLIERIEHPETFVPEQITVSGHLQEGGTIKAIAAL
jgi:LacI family transcriptional regulator